MKWTPQEDQLKAFRSHMTKIMWVQWFSSAKIRSSDNENTLVFVGVFKYGESIYGIYFLIGPSPFFWHFLLKKGQYKAKTANHVVKMYFLATHEEFVQNINPWLCRETICGLGEWKAKCMVKEHNLRTGQNLYCKTALSYTESGMIHVNKTERSTKENMALRPDL